MDNGWNELDSGVLKPIRLDDGTMPHEPFKLDGHGHNRSDNQAPVVLPDKFIYEEVDFATLGLPNVF